MKNVTGRAVEALQVYYRNFNTERTWIDRLEVVEHEAIDSYVVGLVRVIVGYADHEPGEFKEVLCECHAEEAQSKDYHIKEKARKCERREAYREHVRERMRSEHGSRWETMPLKEVVMELWERYRAGEYLGEFSPGSALYAQEVAAVLGREVNEDKVFDMRAYGDILEAIDSLFAEERLDLNGMILAEYVRRCRFPKEIQGVLRYIIEEPLGWPNGEAGDGFVYGLERRVTENTGAEHGADLFGENYPRLSPVTLFEIGLLWLYIAIWRDFGNAQEFGKEFAFEDELVRIAKTLTALAGKLQDADLAPILHYRQSTSEFFEMGKLPQPDPSLYFPAEIRLLFYRTMIWNDEVDRSWVLMPQEEDRRDPFYEHNHPGLDTNYLMMFGFTWISQGARMIADHWDRGDTGPAIDLAKRIDIAGVADELLSMATCLQA